MTGVALVFYTALITGPFNPQGPQISNKLFDSKQECAEFVNTVADDGTGTKVVDENYEFKFASVDGLMFVGGCYTPEEFKKKYYIVEPGVKS